MWLLVSVLYILLDNFSFTNFNTTGVLLMWLDDVFIIFNFFVYTVGKTVGL